jgi:hypothetical protein
MFMPVNTTLPNKQPYRISGCTSTYLKTEEDRWELVCGGFLPEGDLLVGLLNVVVSNFSFISLEDWGPGTYLIIIYDQRPISLYPL